MHYSLETSVQESDSKNVNRSNCHVNHNEKFYLYEVMIIKINLDLAKILYSFVNVESILIAEKREFWFEVVGLC